MDIPALRLANQEISVPRRRSVRDLVSRFGAVQAQEFPFAKWGIGLRLKGVRDEDVEDAFSQGEILRTHVLRPTWHFVTADDIKWILQLSAPRVHAANAYYYRQSGLDAKVIARSCAMMARVLEGGN